MGRLERHFEPLPITATTPLRLDVAASYAFPDGSMKAAGLRLEARRGRLQTERIAGKEYTTLAHIEEMRELCRTGQKALVSTSDRPSEPGKPHGSSETRGSSSALAAARATAQALKRGSLPTSPKSTGPADQKTVVPLKSTSQTS